MIDNDDLFDALADSQRRQLLVRLLDRDSEHIPYLSDASQEVADANEVLLHKYLSSDREHTAAGKELLRTYCRNLPKLAEYGFIEWDREAHVVTKGPRFDEVKTLLESIDDLREARSAPGSVGLLRR